jgi:hypothetical protein
MEKNIKKIKTKQKPRTTRQKKTRVTRQQQNKKEKDNVNVNIIRIDQSKKSLNRTKGVSQPRQQPYIPIPPIMINPSTQTNPQINPFSFSDIKDVVRNVLGESINNRQASVQFVGEEMQNPYGMKTPSQNTSSKLYQSIPKSEEDTTFGNSYQNRIYPFDDWIDVDKEKESIRQQNESLSTIFGISPNQTLSSKLNSNEFGTPLTFSSSKLNSNDLISSTGTTLSKKEKRKQQLNQNYLDRKSNKLVSPSVPLDISRRTQQQLLEQADELGIDTYNESRKGRGTKRLKTRLQLIDEITDKLNSQQTFNQSPRSEIFQYSGL